MDLITAIVEFFTQLLASQKAFVVFSFLVLTTQWIAIWALWVSHVNKAIAAKRRELGMNEVDQSIELVLKVLHSHYLTLAKMRFGPDYFNMKETAIYRYLLILALDGRRPVYRARIRRNHFNEKSPVDWQQYVADCVNEDITAISRYLDEHYHPQARIPRPEVYDWNQQQIQEVKREIERLFCQLLRIAEENRLRKFFGVKLEFGGGI